MKLSSGLQSAHYSNPDATKNYSQTYANNPVGYLIITLPVLLLLSIGMYKKCKKKQFERNIVKLEKLLKINVKNNTSNQD
jgi:hypothetical protein